MHAFSRLELVIIRWSIQMGAIFVFSLLHYILLIIIARMIMIIMMAMPLSRHLWGRDRAIDTRHGFQHTFQRVRI